MVLGDTNSGLDAILAERMGIPVIHMESGNRCFDLEVPVEKTDVLLMRFLVSIYPVILQSKENLGKEGVPKNRIILSGNPIYEVLEHYKGKIDQSDITTKVELKKNEYFLLTIHQAENADHKDRRLEIIKI